jgi:hypothetical protein
VGNRKELIRFTATGDSAEKAKESNTIPNMRKIILSFMLKSDRILILVCGKWEYTDE